MGITGAVTVVVVTYRSAPTIDACLRSLPGAAEGRPIDIVVVDNASDDTTAARVRDVDLGLDMRVDLVARPTNDGFAVASNAGLARASGEWVLFANPDTDWPAGALNRLVDVAVARPRGRCRLPGLENPDGSVQPSVETDLDLRRVLAGLVRVGGANRPAPAPPPVRRWRSTGPTAPPC